MVEEDAQVELFAVGQFEGGVLGLDRRVGVAHDELAGRWAGRGSTSACRCGGGLFSRSMRIGVCSWPSGEQRTLRPKWRAFPGSMRRLSSRQSPRMPSRSVLFPAATWNGVELPAVVAELFEFLGGIDPEGAVVAEGEDAGEGHGAAPAEVVLRAAIEDPGPHDAAALVVEEAFGGEAGAAGPVHAMVRLGNELLVLPAAQVVAAAAGVGDAEEHVLVAQGEEVGAGDVFEVVDARHVVGQERADVFPLVELGGLEDRGRVAAEDGVVGVALEPAVRVPGAIELALGTAVRGIGDDRIGGELGPAVEILVAGRGDAVAGIDAVIEHDGLALLADETVAAEDAAVDVARPRKEVGRVPPPMEQVVAGGVAPAVAPLVLEDVPQGDTCRSRRGRRWDRRACRGPRG